MISHYYSSLQTATEKPLPDPANNSKLACVYPPKRQMTRPDRIAFRISSMDPSITPFSPTNIHRQLNMHRHQAAGEADANERQKVRAYAWKKKEICSEGMYVREQCVSRDSKQQNSKCR